MSALFCPTCKHAVRNGDRQCMACGADLPEPDTVPGAFTHGALWLDSQVLLPPPVLAVRVVELPPVAPPVPVEDPARRRAKEATRAAVRRARLGQAAQAAGVEAAEVLLLDTDDISRAHVSALLEGFGFRVYFAADAEHASMLADAQAFAAAFVDVSLDESDQGAGIELCRQLRARPTPAGRGPMALVLLGADLHPVDRIRARLAGCDAVIGKPAQRGDLARTLEDCGVPLPSDARQR